MSAAEPCEVRELPASVLWSAYSHVHCGELMLGGMPRREAARVSCDLYYSLMHTVFARAALLTAGRHGKADGTGAVWRAAGEYHLLALFPDGQVSLKEPPDWAGLLAAMHEPAGPPGKSWTTACFTDGTTSDMALLSPGVTWRQYTAWHRARMHGANPDADPSAGTPRARVGAGMAAELRWQCDAMRVVASGGGSLLEAARSAHDRAAGKPRRRREPVTREWLAGRIGGALEAAWQAVRLADDGTGALVWDLPAERPRGGDAPCH